MAIRSINKSSLLRLTSYAKATAQGFSTSLLIILSLFLLIIGKIDENSLRIVKSYFIDFSNTALKVLGKPLGSISSSLDEINSLINIYSLNQKLTQENEALYKWQELAKQLAIENEDLKKQLNAVNKIPYQMKTAELISNTAASYIKTVTINIGSKDGVKIGNPVINNWGMIGRIIEAGKYASRVLLTVDINSQIPVYFEATKQRAILVGKNSDLLELKFFNNRINLIDKDRLLTSGEGGLLPRGISVGTYIESINKNKENIKILPSRNWDRMSKLSVILFDNSNPINIK